MAVGVLFCMHLDIMSVLMHAVEIRRVSVYSKPANKADLLLPNSQIAQEFYPEFHSLVPPGDGVKQK